MSLHVAPDGHVTDEFAMLVAQLAAAYPGGRVVLSEALIRTYAVALGDFPIETVRDAAWRAIRQCRFFPTVAELRGYVEATVDDAALLAWSQFGRAAEDAGAYVSLTVEDPAAAAALVAVFGSWGDYCAADEIAVAGKRAEFMAAYRQARREPGPPRPAAMLTGLCGPPPPGQRLLSAKMHTDGTTTVESWIHMWPARLEGRP